jgi:BASS family bile acid:Na+ symporter
MSIAELIVEAVKLSILLTVFGFGLTIAWADVTSLFRHPLYLLRSIFAMNIAMPIFAIAVALLLRLRPEVAFVLVAFALSPMPPFLPATQIKAGSDATAAAGLLVASSLLAIVIVPIAVNVIGDVLDKSLAAPVSKVAMIVFLSVLAPLAAGMGLRHFAPAFAAKIAKPVTVFAGVLLVVSGLAIAIGSFSAIVAMLGDGTLVAILLVIAAGLGLGYLFGGPTPDDRTALALATAARHPGVALAIAGANVADQKPILAAALLYLIASLALTTPFAKWRGHQHAMSAKTP